jgi:hypothetical protein
MAAKGNWLMHRPAVSGIFHPAGVNGYSFLKISDDLNMLFLVFSIDNGGRALVSQTYQMTCLGRLC